MHAQIPTQQEQQLALHQIDIAHTEPREMLVALDRAAVLGPLAVERVGVVERLGGENQTGQKNAVRCAAHALGVGGKAGAQPIQIHGRRGQSGHGDLGVDDDRGDERR